MNEQYNYNNDKIEFLKGYISGLKKQLNLLDKISIEKSINMIEDAFLNGKKIFIAGNGGSAATASHMASDLQKTTLSKNPQTKNSEIKFKAISLSDNIPLMTARGNDEGYDYIFSEQLKVLADSGDLLIVITGSGNSSNIVKLVEEAKNIGVETIGFLGFNGGKVKSMLDHYTIVESDNYGYIEDIHMIFCHLITAYFKKEIQKIIELKRDILPQNLVETYLKKSDKKAHE